MYKPKKMNWLIIGSTSDVFGKILIGITVLLVHQRLLKENKIDKQVIKEMKREQVFGILGIILIIIGYFIHIFNL